ncbi:TetR/AcrR family transcriptional regulator C-terminal domain-containing protein [Dactylosporangium sp. NBC_01737]|uniref:TetR/AcrR family transcriptional regulator C-terminal domain-containing protein n=1 Tax=Dactylosporangium sp. NBC_01737 TaxID=2975959 RepID=UPI002E0ED8CA|nr:TetR/AcrR family transcriptional regulator C-terminal domain-containing protein [Dactylosporangium sp. NBC_01737]
MTRAAVGVVAELCRRIAAGELRPGEAVPSDKDVARELEVAVGAADRALAMMRQDGLVEDAGDGSGLVVTGQAPDIAAGWKATVRRRGPAREGPGFLALIVRTAIALADAHGLAVTSMRRIAGELDVDFVTLRKYMGDRDHLEILMADAVFAEHPPPQSPAGDWRARLELLCRAQLLMYRRHPWLAEAVSFKQPQLSPHVVAHTEAAVRALAGEGPAPEAVQRLAATAANFVRGHAMRLAQSENRAGADEDAALFEFGLQRLLDGFAPLVP